MNGGAEQEEPDLSKIYWWSPEAIFANPARSLATADLAMDYFAYSPFFDTKSNNSVLRTQRRVENPSYGHEQEKLELGTFHEGFEYVVSHALPPRLFVIQCRDVSDDGSRENNVRGCFFIMDDMIYPSPTVYELMSARLKNASHLISSTFRTLSEAHPPSNPRAPSTWRSLPPTAPPVVPNAEASSSRPAGAPTADGDVSMGTSPAPAADGAPPAAAEPGADSTSAKPQKAEKGNQPDFHLFHALASTRAAMVTLEDISRTPAGVADPREELKALEAQFLATAAPATDPRRPGPRSATNGSTAQAAPLRTWSDPSLSNVPTGPRPGAPSVVMGSATGMTPRPLASTPGMSPFPLPRA